MNDMKLREESITRARKECGDSKRASGRTSRSILTAIMEASKGERLMFSVDNRDYVRDIHHKCCEVIEALIGSESFVASKNRIDMIGGGVICFASRKDNITVSHFKNEDGSYLKFTKHICDHYHSEQRGR